jgi:hypothetical protein
MRQPYDENQRSCWDVQGKILTKIKFIPLKQKKDGHAQKSPFFYAQGKLIVHQPNNNHTTHHNLGLKLGKQNNG